MSSNVINSLKIENFIKSDCAELLKHYSHTDLQQLKNQEILITGGSGFLGLWLCELLLYLNEQHKFNTKVYLLARNKNKISTDAPHLLKYLSNDNVVFIEKDVKDVLELPPTITYVIHAAGTPDNRIHSSDPLNVLYTLGNGTDSIMSASIRLPNLKKFLFISSGLVYGSQAESVNSISETSFGGSSCDSINSVYSEAKRFAETICCSYRSIYKIPVTIARPFTLVGPYQKLEKPWAANNFIRDSLNGGPIRILGNEKTTRSFMYASDFAWWILKILQDGRSAKAYNVGNSDAFTMKELAKIVTKNFPKEIDIVSNTASENTLSYSKFVPDISLAQSTLNLKITVPTEEAIKKTIDWYSLLKN